MGLEIELIETISELPLELWDELIGPESFPFLRRDWLHALERTGTLGAERGWIPRHVVVRRRGRVGGEIVAVAPAYIKLHSMGEFVFDHAWAELSEHKLGVRYYPKFVIAVPFTPATGPRVLCVRGLAVAERAEVFDALSHALPQLAEKLGMSSVHLLFLDQTQSGEFERRGWAVRLGLQYQFERGKCATFEDYLATFKSKRRNQIRREQRDFRGAGVELHVQSGPDLGPSDARLAYRIYLTTVDKYVWGRRYLNQAFFESVFATMPEAIHFVTAREQDGEVIAGAVNLLGSQALYGRYWGCFRELPFLHFNVCLYAGVEETLRRGLSRFEPGAGGEHKQGRGFAATITQSAHYIAERRLDRIVRDFLQREAEAVRELALAEG